MTSLDRSRARITTRLALHALAEHVLSAALHADTGRIGLRRAPGGFGTPAFSRDGRHRQIVVAGTSIELSDGDHRQQSNITTLRAAGEFVGIEPGAPLDVYTPSTPLGLDDELIVDPDQSRVFADWFSLVEEALDRLRSQAAGDAPAIAQLWPEHFDLAATIDQVNFGGSPGDEDHDLPYLYVGPWSPPPFDDFWNESFGASCPATDIDSVEDALEFFHEAQRKLRG